MFTDIEEGACISGWCFETSAVLQSIKNSIENAIADPDIWESVLMKQPLVIKNAFAPYELTANMQHGLYTSKPILQIPYPYTNFEAAGHSKDSRVISVKANADDTLLKFVSYGVRLNRFVSILTGGKKWLWDEPDSEWNIQPHKWLLFKKDPTTYYTLGLSYYAGSEILIKTVRVGGGTAFIQKMLSENPTILDLNHESQITIVLPFVVTYVGEEMVPCTESDEPPLAARHLELKHIGSSLRN